MPHSNLLSQLEDLVVGDPNFQKLDDQKNYFCPFEAIGMVDQEIRHAHFLAYILNPDRPHRFDDAYLRAFLHVAASAAAENIATETMGLRPIDVHFRDLSNVRLARERDRIDLRVILPPKQSYEKGTVLIFEVKINAGESLHQLSEYSTRMRREYSGQNIHFFFFTLDGSEPSEENRSDWNTVSFEDVLARFEEIERQSFGTEEARAMVRAYIRMMRRNLLTDSGENELRDLARELWSKHKEALEFLVNERPDDVSDLLQDLYNSDTILSSLRSATGLEFEMDNGSSARQLNLTVKEFNPTNRNEEGQPILALIVSRNYNSREEIRFRWFIWGSSPRAQSLHRLIGHRVKLKSKFTQLESRVFKLSEKERSENNEAAPFLDQAEKDLCEFAKLHINQFQPINPAYSSKSGARAGVLAKAL